MTEKIIEIQRFIGTEYYHVESSLWKIFRTNNNQYRLLLTLVCDKPIKQFEDTEYLNNHFLWEVSYILPNKTELVLNSGDKFKTCEDDKNLYGDMGIVYFVDHMNTRNNRCEILDKDNSCLKLKLYSEVEDFNAYGVPCSRLIYEGWFEYDAISSGANWIADGEESVELEF